MLYATGVTTRDQPLGDWLASLASRNPTPGGGAAAALSAATGAALIGMVASYTTGPKWADREERMRALADQASVLRADALAVADDDVAAFSAVSAAYKLPRQTPAEQAARSAEIQRALIQAAAPPVRAGQLAARIVEMAAELADSGNPSVLSDVAVASSAARAALEAAIVNIEINRREVKDREAAARLGAVIGELEAAIAPAGRVVGAVRERLRS